ncbi:PAS domain-containing protein [Coralloluteibacterium thermophilus]|uniref:histidine kinase n=1 Tax=Coralloluteibacterium thermophilum TaxID=2707049 RepID=A0ABV9NRC7_9GAMM
MLERPWHGPAATDVASVGGQVGAQLRTQDWSGSPLGPPDAWQPALQTLAGLVLQSKFPMFLAWGPELGLLYNDAYGVILGAKHPGALGRPFREVWAEVWEDVGPLVDAALTGEAIYREDLPLVIERSGLPERAWFTFSYSPVRDEEGRIAGIFCAVAETTAKVLSERRQAFRVMLEDRLRHLASPRALIDAAVEALALHLGAQRVGYAQVQADGETVLLDACYADGVPPLLGSFALSEFGPESIARQRRGLTDFCDDVLADPAQVHETWRRVDTRAFVSVPMIRDGVLRATLYVNVSHPHHWLPEEIALIELVAARIWDALERVRAETERRDSEMRLRLALQAGRMGEVTFDAVNGTIRHSEAFAEMLGHPPGRRLTLADLRAQYHPEDRDRIIAEREAILKAGQTFFEVDMRIVRPDGEVRWLYGRGQVFRDIDGHALTATTVYLDNTERKQAEQALRALNETLEQQVAARTGELRANQARMRAAFETSYTFQGLLAPDGTILDVNATALRPIEAHREDVVGLRVWEAPWFSGTPGMPETIREAVGRVAAGRTYRQEIFVKLPAGWRWFDFSMRPIVDENGAVTAIVPEAVETTERREAEDALRQAQKLEAMGQLTGGVAHDFNNLLTPIIGSLDMLQRKGVGGERDQRLIGAALQAADRAKTLVHRLLAFARRQPLQTAPVDVGRLVGGMATLIASTSGPQIRVEVDVADGVPPAQVDANQLEMAVLNLGVNARDAMPAGGTLSISVTRAQVGPGHRSRLPPGEYVRLSVADTGIGMDAETQARAIEPFFSTKGVGRGTGLGLSMVHGLVSQLGGALTIQSRLAVGTNIELWLPRAASPVEEASAAAEAEHRSFAGIALLVDDEDLVRLSTANMLSDLGYVVVEAASAEAALRRVAEGLRPDVLVTDHLMPGMNGTDLARRLRSARPELAVLIVSGYAESEGIAADLPRLAKPFRASDLAECLARLTQPASAA